MKRLSVCLLVLAVLLSCAVTGAAADGKVTYSGDAGSFVFEPGSDDSLTDLFPNFKDVMPGDTLTQDILVKNDASNEVKVKIWLRALGAQAGSEAFLSQLRLRVKASDDNTMAYMFDAAAHETAQLTEWVCLGTLYSGGEVRLEVTLDVPTSLGNEYEYQKGYLDWEFMVEEFPVEEDDPTPPDTGDEGVSAWWLVAACIAAAVVIVLLRHRRAQPAQ